MGEETATSKASTVLLRLDFERRIVSIRYLDV